MTLAGADLNVYIPHRIEEGYGLNVDAVNRLAGEGTDLLITVDCGIGGHEAVRQARAHGMDVIITDHHEPGKDFPSANAVVHPSKKQQSDRTNVAIEVNPCGATVAFKLAWALARELSGQQRVHDEFRQTLVELTALVAMATVADVVPLLGENRILTKFGLERIGETKLVGLEALLAASRLSARRVESYHVAFVLGPRLNAAGRMDHARKAFDLLTTTDHQLAQQLAGYLDKQNTARQKLEKAISREAVSLAESQGQLDQHHRVLVLAKEGWHAGVLGIVASRLVEQFRRPAVMIALDGLTGRGSARSVEDYDINQALGSCGRYLVGYGGHAMAAGLQIESNKVAPFANAIQEHAGKHLKESTPTPTLKIDAEIEPESVTSNFLWQLQRLRPFGHGNPRPIFATGKVELVGDPKIVGRTGQHLAFDVRWGKRIFRAIAFNQADACEMLLDGRRCRLAFDPVTDEYAGSGAIQLRVKSIRPVD